MNAISPQLALVIFIVIGGFFLFVYIRDQQQKAELRKRGVTVTARVTDRQHQIQTQQNYDQNHVPTNTTTTNSYSITFQYTVNGTTYNGRENVDVSVYDALRDGQPVEVVYLPENPAQARLASDL
jgi:hypothetical protein